MGLTVAFHGNRLGLRGTQVAIYDYARYNEELLGNRSIIVSPKEAAHEAPAIERFAKRFEVALYENPTGLDDFLERTKADVCYFIKSGENDGILTRTCKNVVHAVFRHREPHGDIYAYISEWLSNFMSDGQLPWVPHIVEMPASSGNLRRQLGIPSDAIVFGRYGGVETFDIPFAQVAVREIAKIRPDRFFLFMNTAPFCAAAPNIIHLEGSSDPLVKRKFIDTCDAMLHARTSGETFGLAVGEFSVCNKPILSWSGSEERCHLEILGDKAITYSDANELVEHLMTLVPDTSKNWDCYSAQFSPKAVMRQFEEVFLAP